MIQQTGRHRDPDKFGNPGLIPGSLFCLRKCKLKVHLPLARVCSLRVLFSFKVESFHKNCRSVVLFVILRAQVDLGRDILVFIILVCCTVGCNSVYDYTSRYCYGTQ